MDDHKIKTIIKATIEELSASRLTDRDTHELHHEWLKQEIEAKTRKEARRRKLNDAIFGSLVVTSILGFFSGAGYLVKSGIEHILQHIK